MQPGRSPARPACLPARHPGSQAASRVHCCCTGLLACEPCLLPPRTHACVPTPLCRRGLGDTSVDKLSAAAAARGVTLSALLFGAPSTRDGGAAGAAALPPLPDRQELGLTARAAAAVEAFRQTVAALRAEACGRPLASVLESVLVQVGTRCYI